MLRLLVCSIILLFTFPSLSSELYRYQDENGRWVFGDKKSLNRAKINESSVEKLVIKDTRKKIPRPTFESIKNETKEGWVTTWQLMNPLPVTVQHGLFIKNGDSMLTSVLAKPYETLLLSPSDYSVSADVDIKHYYLIGEPMSKPKGVSISPPYSNKKQFFISQGFNGRFSHTGRGSRYALDIAMPIGENILAVKGGIVADARDDFSIGGAANYFLDKANHVTVMHDDGSYAVYAHILHGSLAVNLAQRVEQGQVLARIGNTGYSTGPHLHFVMRYNSGKGALSIPFKLITEKGARVPKAGQYYSGRLNQLDEPFE